ncbi:MAG TPA: FAD-dependent oxidoreductase [Acidimicrobiales bacterium]|nr:FAD-dependent oxidoreductase [Acidimicrobiales bacterium]
MDVAPLSASRVGSWDDEADVVVVGLGCAGASAVLGACEAGAEVIGLERSSAGGGTSAQSGGVIYLGGGTPVQRACGFEDSAEDMRRFLVAACGPDADEAKIALYSEGSVDHFHWLADQGVRWHDTFYAEPVYEVLTDDGLMFSGGEEAWPFCEIARPAPRGHYPRTEGRSGVLLMKVLLEAVDRSPARVRTDTVAERLVVADDGRVVGLVARRFGDEVRVRARGGVILAGGGFVANDRMLTQHAPWLVDDACYKVGTDTDDGRAIRMAQALGAAVRHMDAAEVSNPAPPNVLMPSLLVNSQGQRFINEDVYHGRSGQVALFRQDKQVYLVLDEEIHEANPSWLKITWAAETLEELESDMGLPAGSLRATVELYNRHAEAGEDPLFHKNRRWLKPLRPPFGAVDLRKGLFGVFTLGGLHTGVDGAVLDLDGEAIPGLYAAGRTASGIPAWGYVSGISLGEGTFFGRAAGAAAAGTALGA